jgi:hypothetical protein
MVQVSRLVTGLRLPMLAVGTVLDPPAAVVREMVRAGGVRGVDLALEAVVEEGPRKIAGVEAEVEVAKVADTSNV